METKQISLKDVLKWVIDNCEDVNAMNEVNTATYRFTSKYKGKNEIRASA